MKPYFSLFVTVGLLLATKSILAKECALPSFSPKVSRLKYLSFVPHVRLKYSISLRSGMQERDLEVEADEPVTNQFSRSFDNDNPIHFIGVKFIWELDAGVYSEAHEMFSRTQRTYAQNALKIRKNIDARTMDKQEPRAALMDRVVYAVREEALEQLQCEFG